MFSDSDRDFMAKNMKIKVCSIEAKLNEPFFEDFKEIAIDAISKYIGAIEEFEASGVCRDPICGEDNEAKKSIRAHFCEIADGVTDNDVMQVLDALRYAFEGYACNGLHQLYTRQENQCWHPKIWLTEVLLPNDIDSLPHVMTLYRGCNIDELKNNSFGQAWSTSLAAAKEFAYTHYRDQKWFDESNRIVLKAKYFKNHVLFSDQSNECEVVVNVEKLNGVRRYT